MTLCDPCRRRCNLVDRKRRQGKPTRLTKSLCDDCKRAKNEARRKGGHGGDRTSAAYRARNC